MTGGGAVRYGLVTTVFVAAACMLSLVYRVPLIGPDLSAVATVGVHYLLPLFGVIATGLALGGMSRQRRLEAVCFVLTFAVILWIHFNVKLWVPLIRPVSYDPLLWQSDQALRPIVDAAIACRRWLGRWMWGIDHLYMNGFVLLFYTSLMSHAGRPSPVFREMMLAVIVFQGLGGFSYLLFPAVGPFIYETGVNPLLTDAQHHMLDARRALQAGGAGWLAKHGSGMFVAPLAAMPSLHTGGAALFLHYAWRDCRFLLPLYVPLFAFIVVAAVASRFHYVVDLPAGVALAAISIGIARQLTRAETRSTAPLDQFGELQPA